MTKSVAQKLEYANKLIFVKHYKLAERVLDEILESEEGSKDMIVHVRRIELASMLKTTDQLKNRYIKQIKKSGNLPHLELCIALVDQQGDLVPQTESVSLFQDLIKRHGESAAAYYGIAFGMENQKNYERAIFNYEQSLNVDSNWYLSYFGMSQIYYQMGDEKKGDHYFYLFEKAAPYNVYGNFETHRNLSADFLEDGQYSEAEAAITSLSEWWIENKGQCPTEIQIYELLATAKISEYKKDLAISKTRRAKARDLAAATLDDPDTRANVLYFIAKVMEEHDELDTSYDYYKTILRRDGSDPGLVQRIGSQFLSIGEYAKAKELFSEAVKIHPENPDIRFCLLVSELKETGVNVEEYLIGRERLRQLVDTGGDRVELLALLHSLMSKFNRDPEVHGHLGDVYLRLGNLDRAEQHYVKMYEIDGQHRVSALKYAAFLMQYKDPEDAIDVLNLMPKVEEMSSDERSEIYWLKSSYHSRKGEFRESLQLLEKVLEIDPWNVSYLIQKIINLAHLQVKEDELSDVDPILAQIQSSEEKDLDWTEFEAKTVQIESAHYLELGYTRRKLRFLYDNGSSSSLLALVRSSGQFDASRGAYDFMKLLNTNFDGPSIYWALGTLFKELWQLETAGMWFEQMLLFPGLDEIRQSIAYKELSDCYIWRGVNLNKALEFARLAVDLGGKNDVDALRTLAHAYLRVGQVREASLFVEQLDMENDPEVRYLSGLILYRNGSKVKANEVWKPLLTYRSETLRFHNIKQSVLRYYFDGEPYLKAN